MKIAIYSRKSKFTGKGESIENQIALCRDYIQHNIPEANDDDIIVYEDEGFSAKNLDRPQFKLMMKHADREPFDYIVVYRLDRISRNVGDFAQLIEKLNSMKTAFVCIKERFDTSTPMGRAMMNIAAVFAQLERETIAERVRDNTIMLARTGRWLGGVTPTGFSGEKVEIKDGEGKTRSAYKLTVKQSEMNVVRILFSKFLELRSLTGVATWCIKNDIKTREGCDFRLRAVRDILTNPVYCVADELSYEYFKKLGCDVCIDKEQLDGKHGLMPFGRTIQNGKKYIRNPASEWIIALGKHKGIISSDDWIMVQQIIGGNSGKTFYRPTRNQVSVFSGLLRCGNCGHIMRPRVNSNRHRDSNGNQTFTYMCEYKERSRKKYCEMCNVNGNILDESLCRAVLDFNTPKSTMNRQLDKLRRESEQKSENIKELISALQKDIDEKKNMISNLLNALAKGQSNSTFLNYANKEIERLDADVEKLEREIAELSFTQAEHTARRKHYLDVMNNLTAFRDGFDRLSVVEKRDYMYRIIDKVIWDGENAHIHLKAINDN